MLPYHTQVPAKFLRDPLVDEEAMKPERCKKVSINLLSHTPDGTVFCLPIHHIITGCQGKYSNEFLNYICPICNFRLFSE